MDRKHWKLLNVFYFFWYEIYQRFFCFLIIKKFQFKMAIELIVGVSGESGDDLLIVSN